MDVLSNAAFPHPNAAAFDCKPWEALASNDLAPANDRAIARLALTVAQMLAGVRAGSATTLKSLPSNVDARVAPYIGYLNFAALEVMVRSKVTNFSADKNPFVEALHGKVERLSKSAEISADDALATLVDASRFTLYELMHRNSSEYCGQDDVSIETIKHHFDAGQHYKVWTDIWQEVVHRGMRLEGDSALRYSSPRQAIGPAIANYRVRRRALGTTISAGAAWARAPHRWKLAYAEVNIRIEKSNGCLRFRRSNQVPEEVPFQLLMRELAKDELSPSALSALLPRFDGITANQLIACWQAIAGAIEEFFFSKMTKMEIAYEKKQELELDLSGLVPVFDRLSLIGDVSAAAGVGRAIAAQAVNAMTFRGTAVRSIWGSPLVALSNDKLGVVATPFLSGTYLYPLRAWFNDGGADLSEKGFAFEAELYEMFEVARNEQLSLVHWQFFKNANIRCVVRKEEIDLLLLTGERVFAIEAKCFLPGYEPRETARYQAAVCKAMDQAKRKASNLAASRSALKSFLKDGKVSATLDLDSCPISPVVVLYHPLGAGTGDEECPVVDRITLSKFLGNEVPRPMVQTEFGWSYIGNPEPVYRTAAEADGMFLGYVADPPILRGYQKQVVEAFAELFSFEGTPTGIRACHFDIQPDAEEVSVYEQLTKRSE